MLIPFGNEQKGVCVLLCGKVFFNVLIIGC